MEVESSGYDAASFLARLHHLLGGAKPYPWAAAHGLSRGAIGRMLKGQWPDPEKMVPLVRSEGVSLSWLLTGQGAPYLVHSPSTDAQGADLVRQLAEGMSRPEGVLVCNVDDNHDVVAVLTEQVESLPVESGDHASHHTEIIGGQRLGALTARAVVSACQAVTIHMVDGGRWRRLASGYMALSELRTLVETQLDATLRLDLHHVASPYQPIEVIRDLSDWERLVLESLRSVPQSARDTVAAMVQAAANVSRERR